MPQSSYNYPHMCNWMCVIIGKHDMRFVDYCQIHAVWYQVYNMILKPLIMDLDSYKQSWDNFAIYMIYNEGICCVQT